MKGEVVLISGYANRIITLKFPEMAEEGDEIFVVLRNPKTVSLKTLTANQVPTNPDGTPDQAAAEHAGYSMLTQLVIGGRLYDATVNAVDENGFPVDQPLLTYPLTIEKAQKLPVEIINKIFTQIQEAQNPH